ncbi:D-alanyl-D-alanine carboxypeptidase family protein [uncultured Allofournierella sp.]|uniref:D-alanyl-D-alanine carboxypeptidase family protein n=1 Tax=uncultured Allofournierella sp. TaxID=1940258 RepID=UPI0037525927
MKKITASFVCFLVMVSVLVTPAHAAGFEAPFQLQAKGAYVVNTDTNIIVYDYNSEDVLPAASLTKLMANILLVEQCGDQLDTVKGELTSSIRDTLYGQGMATADIRMGEPHTLRSLMYASLLPSAADATMIIANTVSGGSISNFVYQMNSKAKELGCTSTHFVDPVGMSLENVTTARDMYLILRYAMSFDVLKEAMSTLKFDMGQDGGSTRYAAGTYNLFSTNRMADQQLGAEYYRDYCKGGKTGTLEDWQNFASWHVSPETGETYISVVLNSPISLDSYGYPTKRPALIETAQVMDWVYESFAIQPAMQVGEPLAEVKVKYSTDADTVMLYPADDMMTILPLGADETVTQKTFQLPESVSAPIHKGDVLGTVTVSLSGQVIGVVELTADRDLSRNELLFTISKIGEFFGSLYFKVLLCVSAATVVLYVVLFFGAQSKQGKSKRTRRRSL